MPINHCSKDGKPGFRFGITGKCFTYTTSNTESRARAKKKAQAQERAIRASGFKE